MALVPKKVFILSFLDIFDRIILVDLVFERSKWSTRGVDFSPTGKYIATYHEQGIALWVYTPHFDDGNTGGRPKSKGVWSRSHRFKHDSVDNLQFSPDEKYIVTGNGARGDQNSTVTVHEVLHQIEMVRKTSFSF